MAETPVARLQTSQLPDLCEWPPSLLRMTGLFVRWMQLHFQEGNIVNPGLAERVWRADPRATGLVVESHTVWDPRVTQYRPSVVVKRQAWQRIRLGIDNRLMGGQSAARHYVNHWQGAHTLFCVAGEAGEAEHLAAEVYQEVNQFAPDVRRAFDLPRLEPAGVGALGKLAEAKDAFAVPVNVGYVLQEAWQVRQEAPLLQSLVATISIS